MTTGEGISVLYVDGDPEFSSMVAAHLEREGADEGLSVETTTDPREALDRLVDVEADVDCLVSDYGMPGTNGLELLRAARRVRPDLPFILYTGRGSEVVARDAFRVGATDYVRKTTGSDQYAVLADRVMNAVSRRRREQERTRERLKDLVLDTSTTLMSAEVDEIETKIRWTLQNLGEFAGLDGAAVYSYDPDALRKIHEWTADGAAPGPNAVASEDCEWLIDRLCRFENVRAHGAASVPPAVADALSLPEEGSFLAVPMVSSWSFVGAVTFVSAEPRRWPRGEVSLFGTATDTLSYTLERKRRERQLRQQNERLEEFASVVSHDLRNPMNVASGFVDLARETGDVSHLDRAVNALDRMNSLVNDVLELARRGRTVGDTSAVDVAGVVERAWGAVETDAATLELREGLGTVTADAGRLTQVVENLVRNAVEHGSAGDRTRSGDAPESAVVVTVGSLPDRDGFYVEDDGPGIPPEARATVFEQGHTTTEGGSGFGLSIVEGIVEAHGWTIGVTEGSSGGARFEIVTTPRARTFDADATHAE